MNQYLGRDEYDDDDFAEGFTIYDTWTQTQADSWDDADVWLDAYAEAQTEGAYDAEAQQDEDRADAIAYMEWLDTFAAEDTDTI